MGCPSTLLAGEQGRGRHTCWTYRSPDVHRQFLTAFFAAGHQANERLMYFAGAEQIATACSSLAEAGLDVPALVGRGALSVFDVSSAPVTAGFLDPDRRVTGHAVLVQQALDDGFDGLRICSEVASLLSDKRVNQDWCGYELRTDLLIADLPSVVVCACDLEDARIQGEGVVPAADLTAVHSRSAGSLDPAPCRLHAQPEGALALSGEVDSSWADRLGQWLRAACGDLNDPVLDVSGVEFIDAAGMWALLDSAHAHPAGLELRGTSAHFRRVWCVCGYDTFDAVRLH